MYHPEMEIKTSIGTLVVRETTDSEYPGVDIVLMKPGIPYEMNVALVEVSQAEGDDLAGKLVTRVWGDANQEDYTHLAVHKNVEMYFNADESEG